MTEEYNDFLKHKRPRLTDRGKPCESTQVHPMLFPFQRDIVVWAVRKGRAAIFLDTGLGKTFCQLEWSRLLGEKTLLIAPLSVARQTVREATKIGIAVQYARSQAEVNSNLTITNYEMIDNFDFSEFGAIVLDESSILKSLSGVTRKKLTEAVQNIPYRLCCTATPAPNDYIELGNHANFLGICTQAEMLAMFFVNANKEHMLEDAAGNMYRKKGTNAAGTEWRLKHHAEGPFFHWLSSWAMTMTKPSDLGYDDNGFILPALTVTPHFVKVDYQPNDQLFFTHLRGLGERHEVRRETIAARLEVLTSIVKASGIDEQWLIWVGQDEEGKAVCNALPETIEVKGSDSPDSKATAFEGFQDGKFRILVTKAKIGGFGMNFQNAHFMAFFGLTDSWESYYQCIRREWRYRQTKPVSVHIIMSEYEDEIYRNVMRKDAQAKRLRQELVAHIRNYEQEELTMHTTEQDDYTNMVAMILPEWLKK